MSDNQSNPNNVYKPLWEHLQALFYLEVDNLKLLTTEKLTVLLTRITFCAVAFILSTCVLVFVSMGVSDILLRHLAPCWTYLIVAGFYAVIVALVFAFRRQVIGNPIARFLSRVILDPPANPSANINSKQE